MSIKYVIGIDIGTTNIKGSLYSSLGEYISSHSVSNKSYIPKEGYHEQNPDDWVNGLIKILEKLITQNNVRENLAAISLSTQGGTVVPVDINFKPLTKAFTWLDRRAANLLYKDKTLLNKNIEFYNRTGWRLDSNMSFLPLYWFKKNKPELFNKIYKILYVNDYILKEITGNNIQDPSNASITLFFNIKTGKWDNEILDLLDLNKNNFSLVKDSGVIIGNLKEGICQRIGVRGRIKVINGGHDQYCAGLGGGVLNEKEILLTTGTAWVIFKMLDDIILDNKRFFSIGRNILKDKYGLIYSIPAAGASLKWFATNIMNLEDEKKLFKEIKKNETFLMKIKNNLIFHPYLTGAYGPDFNLYNKASFSNIDIGYTYLEFIKAIMEGVGFQLKKIFITFEEKGIKIEKIKMVGGGAKSKIWPQIIADITNADVLIPENENEDFAVKGAAILAGYGAGIFSSIEEGYDKLKSEFKIIKPNFKNRNYYEDKFKMFIICADSWKNLTDLNKE